MPKKTVRKSNTSTKSRNTRTRKKPSKLLFGRSRNQVYLFVALFAAVGGFFVYRSYAATSYLGLPASHNGGSDCRTATGTAIKETSGSKKNVTVCSLTANKTLKPIVFQKENSTFTTTESQFLSLTTTVAGGSGKYFKACYKVASIGGSATFAIGDYEVGTQPGAGTAITQSTNGEYVNVCDPTPKLAGSKLLFLKTTAGTLRVSSVTIQATAAPVVTPPPPPTGSYPAALWHANADTDAYCGEDDTLFYHRETDNAPIDRLQIVNDPLGQHGKVYQSHLTPSDISAGNKRAEWRGSYTNCDDRQKYAEKLPQELYYGWRALFGKDVALTGNENDGNYMQMKGDSSCGGPAVGMTIRSNRLTIRTIDGDYLAWNGPAMSSLLDNKWHDFVLRINYAKDSTGWVEMWLDGVKQTMNNGQQRINLPTVCPNDTHVFFKLGVYGMDKGVGVGPQLWTESPRIGTSYEAVVPR